MRNITLRRPMQVQVARISPVMMEVAVEVPADAVKVEVEKIYADLQKKARVRGFRPGKAPRQVLVHLYGPQVTSDVVNALVTRTLPRALSDKNVQPVNQPQVEPGKFEQNAAFSYKARFEVSPEIGELAYEGLDLVRPSMVATEAMVDDQLERLRKAHSRLQPPEAPRSAQKGDVVTIDFKLTVEGKELKEGDGAGVQLELGSGQVLPELDAALSGKNVDDEFEVSAQFPAEHPRAELRGKSATFHGTVKDLKERVLPALDDEFAKDVGTFQTLVELRADVHTRLEKMLKDAADTALAEQVIEKLNEKNPVDVPPSLVEQQCREMELELLQNARQAGQQPSKEDLARVHDRLHGEAEKKVRAGLIMAAIAKKLAIQVTDQDIQKGLEELSVETGKNVAKVRAEYSDPQRRNILIGMILEDKVLDVIESKASVRDGGTEAPSTTEPVEATNVSPKKVAGRRSAKKESAEPTAGAVMPTEAKAEDATKSGGEVDGGG
ncbi:MAG: trigger factor [Myxococcota bacterium]|nr:trigger factor [Myxococcota bacterium]